MTMSSRQVIVGVFDEPAVAGRTVDQLQRAGFAANQISYSDPTQDQGTGFMAGLKRLFTGRSADAGTVADDLTNMGLSSDEANYYSEQFDAGHAIVAVIPDGSQQEQDAISILQSNGAYNYTTRSTATQTGTYAQSADYGQAAASTQSSYYGQTATPAQSTDYTQTTTPTQTTDYTQTDTYAQPATPTQTTGYTQTDTYAQSATPTQTTDYADTEEQRSLRLREEQLRAEKERVQAGEVQLHKDVITEQKTINVPVTREEVYVERRDVSGEPAADTTPMGEGETIRVPVSEEQVRVTKQAVVTGEVAIGKQAVQENQQVTDTVKREEARLERSGDVSVRGADADLVQRDDTGRRDQDVNP